MPASPDQPHGPRPLPLHLGAAAVATAHARLAWPSVHQGNFPWMPSLAHDAEFFRTVRETTENRGFDNALDAEARRRTGEFLAGIEAYRAAPRRRNPDPPPAIWETGTTRLLDYGKSGGKPGGKPVLLVPSLVNRAHILDLTQDSSLVRHLAARGLRPLLVDWGAPGAAERNFTLTEYIVDRLGAALDVAVAASGGPVPVIGYCMGGLLAVALACRRAADVSAIVALATPWDFHAEFDGPPPLLAAFTPQLAAFAELTGELSVDMLQALFFALDPMQGWAKFRRFALLKEGSPEAARFVALEDWANDGVPLAGPVARECLMGWYIDNTPGRGAWRVGGAPVRPETLLAPALVVVPAQDRIVPPASAEALAKAIPGAKTLVPPAGHVGMVVGGRAKRHLWDPLATWLEGQTGS